MWNKVVIIYLYIYFFRNPAFCDVNIKFDNQNTWAHKVILAAKSEYFSSMFLGNFKESNEQVVNICFDNKDLSSTAIDIIVTYMYTLDLEITEDNVQVKLQWNT